MTSSLHDSDSSEQSDILNTANDDGWEDAELDEEELHILCLFGDETFPNVKSMMQHCQKKHDFDFLKIVELLGLSLVEAIQAINYVRTEVKKGATKVAVQSRSVFEDDCYLQPVLEDDALLYSLGDIIEEINDRDSLNAKDNGVRPTQDNKSTTVLIIELREELQRLQQEFIAYREDVARVLDDKWSDDATSSRTLEIDTTHKGSPSTSPRDNDSHYFTSYSYNDIHETMLKDTVRTDAYRDFIYDHKHLFHNKVVLDVGCGTGILSMFCARAGASKVIAVDNSDIIDKARENVFKNRLGDTVTCLRGKIEEVSLPVPKVDIIVSEWMGYCLLYEAMLDSVIWARDRYLSPNGLMVPSHTTLHIAPLSDPDYIADHISFWQSVYGFDMTSMLAHIYDEVLIRDLKSSILPAEPHSFLQLSLHDTRREDLTFSGKSFTMTLKEDIDSLDGFVIWFDAFFLPSRDDHVPADARAEDWTRKGGKGRAFTTGCAGPETHWRQGVLLIDHGKRQAENLKMGQTVRGEIGYRKREDNARELDIEIRWAVEGSTEKGKQVWFMR